LINHHEVVAQPIEVPSERAVHVGVPQRSHQLVDALFRVGSLFRCHLDFI